LASNLPTRQFEFNYIYIVDSLGADELQTASDLYNDIVRWRLMRIGFVQCEQIHVFDKQQFLALLATIIAKVRSGGHFPFIHLEIHGCKEGLGLQSGELVTWEDLTKSLREINILLRNNLFLSMATCYSGYIIGEILPSQPAPFFACIATWEELSGDDIMTSFQSFFDFILSVKPPQRINMNEAVEILNGSSERPWRYYFYNSELLFERIFSEYEKDLWDQRKFSMRVKDMVAQVFASGKRIIKSKNQIRREIEERLIRDRHQQKEGFRRRFLMLDA